MSTPCLPPIFERSCFSADCAFIGDSRIGPADFARAQACLLGMLRVGKEQYPAPVRTRGGPAVRATVDVGRPVSPNRFPGQLYITIFQRKTFAAKQLHFATGAACIPAKSAVRGNYPMTWDVNRHRIVVHCVAHRSRALGRSRRSAQTLIADHSAARNFLELAQNFLLKRTGGEMQINIPAQRLRLSG